MCVVFIGLTKEHFVENNNYVNLDLKVYSGIQLSYIKEYQNPPLLNECKPFSQSQYIAEFKTTSVIAVASVPAFFKCLSSIKDNRTQRLSMTMKHN